METIQSRLVHARKKSGLSQAAVAERVGMSQPTYSQLERGLSRSSAKLVEIARVLGVDPGWLATGKGGPELRAGAEGSMAAPSLHSHPAGGGLDPLQASLLAAAAELDPLQVADLIAYARQLSGRQLPPARSMPERDHLDEPLTANADDPERRRHDYGPPDGVERRAKG